jgi:DNA-binding beta-propeller fold protein YncE
VTPIRTATNTPLKPITVGVATTIVITPNSRIVYVAVQSTGTVAPIRTATNTALRPIKVGATPIGMAITP